jgi:hypothetical protein
VLKEVHVTVGEKTQGDLSSRDLTVSIAFIDEAGEKLKRQHWNIVHEETLMNPFSAAWIVGRAVRVMSDNQISRPEH